VTIKFVQSYSLRYDSLLVLYCFVPELGAKCCDKCVCVSVRWHILKTTRPNFTIFVYVVCGRGLVLFWWFCDFLLCISGFLDDIMFSHNGSMVHRGKSVTAETAASVPTNVFSTIKISKYIVCCALGWGRSLLSTIALLLLLFYIVSRISANATWQSIRDSPLQHYGEITKKNLREFKK